MLPLNVVIENTTIKLRPRIKRKIDSLIISIDMFVRCIQSWFRMATDGNSLHKLQ